jgi:hypothetical protein
VRPRGDAPAQIQAARPQRRSSPSRSRHVSSRPGQTLPFLLGSRFCWGPRPRPTAARHGRSFGFVAGFGFHVRPPGFHVRPHIPGKFVLAQHHTPPWPHLTGFSSSFNRSFGLSRVSLDRGRFSLVSGPRGLQPQPARGYLPPGLRTSSQPTV